MHKTERSSWKPTKDSSLQVYQVNRSAGGHLLSWALDAQVTKCIPGMLPDGWRQMTSTSAILMLSGKGGTLTIIFFFFFFGSPFLFSTSFSIVYSANGQLSPNPIWTEQLGRVS